MEGEHHEGASIPFSQLPLYQEYIAEQRTPQITVTHRTFEFCSPISSSEKPTGVESCVMGSVGASFFQGRLQLEKTRRGQALRQVPPVHLHGKALPKLLQSFGFAKTSFFGLSSTLAKLRFIDRAQPRDPARYLR